MFFNLAYGSYDQAAAGAKARCRPEIPPQVELGFWGLLPCGQRTVQGHAAKAQADDRPGGLCRRCLEMERFYPLQCFSIETGRDALQACIEEKIRSVVITAWGDNWPPRQVYSPYCRSCMQMRPLGMGNSERDRGIPHPYRNPVPGVSPVGSSQPGSPRIRRPRKCQQVSALQRSLAGTFDSLVPADVQHFYAEAAGQLEQIEARAGEYAILFRTQKDLCRVLERKADLGKRIKTAYDSRDNKALEDLAETVIPQTVQRLETFQNTLQEQWLQENKVFGPGSAAPAPGRAAKPLAVHPAMPGTLPGRYAYSHRGAGRRKVALRLL